MSLKNLFDRRSCDTFVSRRGASLFTASSIIRNKYRVENVSLIYSEKDFNNIVEFLKSYRYSIIIARSIYARYDFFLYRGRIIYCVADSIFGKFACGKAYSLFPKFFPYSAIIYTKN